jgi:hypothetical protein
MLPAPFSEQTPQRDLNLLKKNLLALGRVLTILSNDLHKFELLGFPTSHNGASGRGEERSCDFRVKKERPGVKCRFSFRSTHHQDD